MAMLSSGTTSGGYPAPERAEPATVQGRECGTCTLCCKVAAVEELAKPNGAWCGHCVAGKRCTIYERRPDSCRAFYCRWMVEPGLGPEWKPERAKFALVKTNGGRRLTALVDPGNPSAWRRAPYYENLKHWARVGVGLLPELYLVDVLIGARSIVVLPDRDVELGVLAPDDAIHVTWSGTAGGRVIDARKVKQASATGLVLQRLVVAERASVAN